MRDASYGSSLAKTPKTTYVNNEALIGIIVIEADLCNTCYGVLLEHCMNNKTNPKITNYTVNKMGFVSHVDLIRRHRDCAQTLNDESVR